MREGGGGGAVFRRIRDYMCLKIAKIFYKLCRIMKKIIVLHFFWGVGEVGLCRLDKIFLCLNVKSFIAKHGLSAIFDIFKVRAPSYGQK